GERAVVVDERGAVVVDVGVEDAADEDAVVAAVEHGVQGAGDADTRVRGAGQAQFARYDVALGVPFGEPVDAGAGEAAGEVVLAVREQVDQEAVGARERRVGAGGAVQADQDEGRVEGQGGEGGRGESPAPSGAVDGRHDGHRSG